MAQSKPATAAAQPLPPLKMLLCTLLIQGIQWAAALETHAKASSLYGWGAYGAFPRISYQSFGAQSPWINVMQTDDRCDDGYTFIEPRGIYVETPGPIILDNDGNLVWMQTKWGQAMDLKVQTFQGKDYITFWHGTDNGTFGEGFYLMLDDKYEVFKKIVPVGDYTGDLHEFRISDDDTALMTIYHKIPVDMSHYGMAHGWIFDSIFQEVNLTTGELIFEWRASEHYEISESLAPLGSGEGATAGAAFDFFHINSIDKDANGDYLVSSRYMCAVAAINHTDGSILWQLGGEKNSFEDLSGGAATDMTWNHHAAWYENTTLTVFDNGSNGRQKSAKFSRGLMIDLDLDAMTAKLRHAYVSPDRVLSPSQGSVQVLPNDNVLVGWGHTPAFTEYSMDGEVLCDTHIAPLHFSVFGWAKNYRTFKYSWVGRPSAPPDVAMRPRQSALYVSWNGATEVASWMLQSAASPDGEFANHQTVEKKGFETRLDVPGGTRQYVRAVALDADGKELGASPAVSKDEKTITPLLEAPSRGKLLEPYTILALSLFGAALGVGIAYYFRTAIRRGYHRVLRRGASSFKYQSLPTNGS